MFYIRHMAGRRLTRTARAGRKVRRMGLILLDGRRIKRRGVRGTPVGDEDFFKNEELIQKWVMEGLAEVTGPDGRVLNWAVIEAEKSRLYKYQAAGKRFDELKDLLKNAEGAEEAAKVQLLVEGVKKELLSLEMEEESKHMHLEDSNTDDSDDEDGKESEPVDPPEGSDDSDAPPAPEPPAEDKDPEPDGDTPPEGDDEDVVEITEDDLQKMSRADLDELAKEYELDPAEYKNKGQIVDALITAASSAEKEE